MTNAKKFAALMFAGAAISLSAPAAAATPVSIEVSFADLNLASEQGIAALDRRLARAIDAVCDRDRARTLQEMAKARECIAETRDEVMVERDLAVRSANDARYAFRRDVFEGRRVIRFATN